MRKIYNWCYGCTYYGMHTESCDYMLDTGQRRTCPPGRYCTVNTRRAPAPDDVANKFEWDTLKAYAMHKQGVDDDRIAKLLGVRKEEVQTSRLAYIGIKPGNDLRSHKAQKAKKNGVKRKMYDGD